MRQLYLIGFLFIQSYSFAQTVEFVSPTHPYIQYEGRMSHSDTSAALYWPGSSICIDFEGSNIQVLLKDEKGGNSFNVIVDQNKAYKLQLDPSKQYYTLATHLAKGKHSVELFKRTEAIWGSTLFYGFKIEGAGTLFKPAEKKLKMEFFGNSITCGYANEDSVADRGDAAFENNYLSYSSLTARHYHAQNQNTAVSGIGIMLSWFPFTMPEAYDRLNPYDTNSKWNFSAYTPNIVVINLFQNDSWLVQMPAHKEFKRVFGSQAPDTAFIINAYTNFVQSIRAKYPAASIICALGAMDATKNGSPWPGYIVQAVAQMKDEKIYTYFFPYKGTKGHPRVSDQEEMANQLIHFIDTHIQLPK